MPAALRDAVPDRLVRRAARARPGRSLVAGIVADPAASDRPRGAVAQAAGVGPASRHVCSGRCARPAAAWRRPLSGSPAFRTRRPSACGAVLRTLWRMLVARRGLLEWSPYDGTGRGRRAVLAPVSARCGSPRSCRSRRPPGSPSSRPAALVAALPILALWFAAPVIAWWLSRPLRRREAQLTASPVALPAQDRAQDLGVLRAVSSATKTTGCRRTISRKTRARRSRIARRRPTSACAAREPDGPRFRLHRRRHADRADGCDAFARMARLPRIADISTTGTTRRPCSRCRRATSRRSTAATSRAPADPACGAGSRCPTSRSWIARVFDGLADTLAVFDGHARPDPAQEAVARLQACSWTPLRGSAPRRRCRRCATPLRQRRTVRDALAAAVNAGARETQRRPGLAALVRQCRAALDDLLLAPLLGTPRTGSRSTIPTLRELAAGGRCRRAAARHRGLRSAWRSRRRDSRTWNYEFLYDRTRHLLAIGYNVDDSRRDTSYYDLLASEARLRQFRRHRAGAAAAGMLVRARPPADDRRRRAGARVVERLDVRVPDAAARDADL